MRQRSPRVKRLDRGEPAPVLSAKIATIVGPENLLANVLRSLPRYLKSNLQSNLPIGDRSYDEPPMTDSHVTIIGAGIIGVCCARWLQRSGFEVTLIDRGEPGAGCSFGNAGIIASTHASVPLPSPEILRAAPGMLFDREASLVLRWGYLVRFLPWLRHFVAACSSRRQVAGARALYALLSGTTDAYDRLLESGGEGESFLRRNGLLTVYDSEASFESGARERKLLADLGVEVQEVKGHEVRQLEPALTSVHRALLFPEPYRVTDPFLFTQSIAHDVQRAGGIILNEEVGDVVVAGGRVREVRTNRAAHPIDRLVVAAGAWSHLLARMMGLHVVLDTERGYHVQIRGLDTGLSRGVLHHDLQMGLNQMRDGLRIAGTVEFAGVEAEPDYRRTGPILKRGLSVLRDVDGVDDTTVSRWMGCRPTLPDYLPAIGPAPGTGNAWFAFGHQHFGLTLGARTGEIVADLVAGRDPGLDLHPFRAERFA